MITIPEAITCGLLAFLPLLIAFLYFEQANIRVLLFCRHGNHHKPVYDSGLIHDFGGAGHCTDCGEKWASVVWSPPPMPECEPPKPSIKDPNISHLSSGCGDP